MTYTTHTIPCLTDNFAFVIEKSGPGGGVALVDAPEAAPIAAALDDAGLRLDVILLTHHHYDHVDGVEALRAGGAEVWGAKADAHRLPRLDRALEPGEVDLFGDTLHVMDVPGHTVGHIAYYLPAARAAYTGDSLMALGCGRLFEGTPKMMWNSLQALRALPAETMIYSGHEYTEANGRFAATVEPGNAALQTRIADVAARRAAGQWTVPERLDVEIATNPFLRADLDDVKTAFGLPGASDLEAFAAIRKAKDTF